MQRQWTLALLGPGGPWGAAACRVLPLSLLGRSKYLGCPDLKRSSLALSVSASAKLLPKPRSRAPATPRRPCHSFLRRGPAPSHVLSRGRTGRAWKCLSMETSGQGSPSPKHRSPGAAGRGAAHGPAVWVQPEEGRQGTRSPEVGNGHVTRRSPQGTGARRGWWPGGSARRGPPGSARAHRGLAGDPLLGGSARALGPRRPHSGRGRDGPDRPAVGGTEAPGGLLPPALGAGPPARAGRVSVRVCALMCVNACARTCGLGHLRPRGPCIGTQRDPVCPGRPSSVSAPPPGGGTRRLGSRPLCVRLREPARSVLGRLHFEGDRSWGAVAGDGLGNGLRLRGRGCRCRRPV